MYYKIVSNNKEKWILLLHCICSNMHIFDDYIEDLSKEYNIILVDLPGHGKSNDTEQFDLKSVVSELVRILDANNVQLVDIWGISLGAIVANELACIYPNKVNIMILEGAALGLKNKMYLRAFNLFNKLKFLLPSKVYIYFFINCVIIGENKKKIIDIMKEHSSIINRKAIKLWLSIMNEEYMNDIYTKIKVDNVKRVYLMGKKDWVFVDSIKNNIEQNENNRLVVLKDASHLCHLDSHIDILKLTKY